MKKFFVLFPLVLMLAACGQESKIKKDTGVAKEIISFRGISFGKPNAKSGLVKLCLESNDKENCELAGDRFSFVTAFVKFKHASLFDLKASTEESTQKSGSAILPLFWLNQ